MPSPEIESESVATESESRFNKRFVVRAEVGAGCLWRRVGQSVEPVRAAELGLSDRLVLAIDDWAEFYTEIEGNIDAPEVAEEFVSQGFKIAHRLRAEIKGSQVHLVHPTTQEEIEISRNIPA